MRERLKEKPHKEVIKYIFKPSIENDLKRSYNNMLKVNKAHLLMLIEEDIVAQDKGEVLLQVINEMEIIGGGVLQVDLELEELYFNIENYIIEEIGIEIGGQLHTGRSRNDLYATVTRMNVRDKLLRIYELLNDLRSELISKARDEVDTVVTGYTHMQPAEPITVGHYLSGILFSLERDYQRLNNAYQNLNLSPLGSGAQASTSFNINRELTAQYLGFDQVLYNSLDGVASRDYLLEILSSANGLLTNISRLSHDLYIWSTNEFSLVELDDSISAVSSIMPQKKNPIILEHIKSKAAHTQGAYISTAATLKNIPFAHTRDGSVESLKFFWEALNETESAIVLMKTVIQSVKFNKELAAKKAKLNYSTVTELANTLVRVENISFRLAHNIVATFISGKTKDTTSREENIIVFRSVFQRILERDTVLTDNEIELALDPLHNVSEKSIIGGTAFSEVESQIQRLKGSLDDDEELLNEKIEKIENSNKALNSKSVTIKY